ncbi:Sec-independent protein translocase TatB [Microbacterium sp.]|uniref:Sec-independent protein translocase subunit TatA/TatB n=1 Tax=Microbacterium sp. TaxID=51671 RepID=UPI002B716169|nr:Sec-independent protein translocase TatB [Microbacterium sp.]HWK79100.1 Sec-independent protein translocase TatB [Microbacterium sp.]
MLGLSIEKLVLVAICAAVIIGPHRLPDYAQRLSAAVRRLTLAASEARRRTVDETGVALMREDWRTLDPRQYDPRRIIRDALRDADADADATVSEQETPAFTPSAGRWVLSGSSAHPRRVWVPDEETIAAASS